MYFCCISDHPMFFCLVSECGCLVQGKKNHITLIRRHIILVWIHTDSHTAVTQKKTQAIHLAIQMQFVNSGL
jgi:hypothetical protein